MFEPFAPDKLQLFNEILGENLRLGYFEKLGEFCLPNVHIEHWPPINISLVEPVRQELLNIVVLENVGLKEKIDLLPNSPFYVRI